MRKKAISYKIRRRLTLGERFRTIPGPLLKLVAMGFVAAAITGGAYAARRYVAASEDLLLRPERISVRGVPPWIDPASAQELQTPPAGVLGERFHVLDRSPLERLAAYYGRHEWVACVDRVEYVLPGSSAPGGIECRVTLREPLCVVGSEQGQEYCFADRDGRRLGEAFADLPDPALRVPAVAWARDGMPRRGEQWSEERVRQGFYLADLLEREGLRFGLAHWVARIDVGAVGRRDVSEISLVTDHRVLINWGRTPRSEYAGRTQVADTATKLARLRQLLERLGEEGRGVEVNLFEPLEANKFMSRR